MILVTGGAGFIGSNLVAALCARADEPVVVCDNFGRSDKWRNVAKHAIADIVPPDGVISYLREHVRADSRWGRLSAVFHLGANSATTETDVDLVVGQNFAASVALWRICTEFGVRLIYASSAATYGDGGRGFDDNGSPAALARLRPRNPYGWTKHAFDQQAARWAMHENTRPPQWAGLKFFNVYGPNEYHKGQMKSVVAHKFPLARDGQPITLFKSYRDGVNDGAQQRDFVYVDDCVDVMLWLYEHPDVSGLFNVGTGAARSFNDLARALSAAIGQPSQIAYIPMPEQIREHYQYFTEASLKRLRAAGYARPFTSLEDGVAKYVGDYLATDDPYR